MIVARPRGFEPLNLMLVRGPTAPLCWPQMGDSEVHRSLQLLIDLVEVKLSTKLARRAQ